MSDTESAEPSRTHPGLRAGWADAARPARFASLVAALLAALLAAADLAGLRNADLDAHRIFPGSARASFDAGVLLAFLAAAWVMPRAGRILLAVLAAAIGVLEIVEQVAGTHVGVDDAIVAAGAGADGRMSLTVAGLGVALGAAHLLAATGARHAAGVLALAAGVVTAAWLLVYAYGWRAWLADGAGHSAVSTVLGLQLLAVAGVTAVPGGVAQWWFTGRDAGARLARRALPVTVALPVAGFVAVRGHAAGWLPASPTLAVAALTGTGVLALGSWVTARRVARIDLARASTAAELTELRVTYARLVREHAQPAAGADDRAAVIEDRQRIAADLHDIVIQRLFAAGMSLQAAPATADPTARRRLDEVAQAMDRAIHDLRTSIFELRHADDSVGLAQAVRSVAAESARMLGFTPQIRVDDPGGAAEVFGDDILAVLRESLANVARHAAARSVHVALRVADGVVELSVTDDGRGIVEQPHRSGTQNLERRARGHGGVCEWLPVPPSGTRMVWRVPLPGGHDTSLSAAG